MTRQRILLLETDRVLQNVLCDLFGYEDLDVSAFGSLTELQAGVRRYPRAVVVSDSWSMGNDGTALSPRQRAEIQDLGRTAEVVLTTGQRWARQVQLGNVVVLEKPYDMDQLMCAVRAGLERSGRGLAVRVEPLARAV